MAELAAARWLDGRVLERGEPWPELDAPGAFETVRGEGGALFFVREHLARLERGARALSLAWPPPWDPRAALFALAGRLESCALRLVWSPPHLSVVAREAGAPPAEASALVCAPGAAELPRPFGVKTTRRAGYERLRAEALARGAFEALVRAPGGALVEGTITNLFVAAEGELRTPPLAAGALPGIVRAAILTELEREPLRDSRGRSWRAREGEIEVGALLAAEEVLLSNSVVRVLGLARLAGDDGAREDLPGARGPLARALLELVRRLEAAAREPPTGG